MADHEHHDHAGHEHDQGIAGFLRYLRFAPEMWRSDVNSAVVQRLAPQPEETVMDIGAGFGAGTVVALKTGCTVIAVEPTPYMRRILRFRRLVGRAGERLRIVDGTAEATSLPSGSIDAAWAVNTMHHWIDLAAGAAELARVLSPNGRVLLVDEDFEDPSHPDYERFGSKRHEEHEHHFHTVDPADVAAKLTSVGLSVTFAGRQQISDRPALVIEALAPAV